MGRFRSLSAHLPKVRHFRPFSAHLLKVGKCRNCSRTAVGQYQALQHPLPPSEGGTFPAVFCAPSEGGKMRKPLQNGCRAFPVLQRPLPPSEGGTFPVSLRPPSEGEAFPAVFRTPSEGGKMQELLQNGCRTYQALQRPLPPSEGEAFPAVFYTPSEGGKMGTRKTQSGIRTRTDIREREGCSSVLRWSPRRRSRSLPRRRN